MTEVGRKVEQVSGNITECLPPPRYKKTGENRTEKCVCLRVASRVSTENMERERREKEKEGKSNRELASPLTFSFSFSLLFPFRSL